MKLRTTVLIDVKSLQLLRKASSLKKKSEAEIFDLVVKDILRRCLSKSKTSIAGTVKYQNHDDYIVYHYTVSSDLYEACLDLRKLYKVSVSKIINEAIKEFLGGVLGESGYSFCYDFLDYFSNMDNYNLNYRISAKYDPEKKEFSAEILMNIT
ncbi:MAG: hypothetical protein KA015_03575 [Spirochaetes bacterium]|nr:hypothetical protein [Spirochaetota bacterium]